MAAGGLVALTSACGSGGPAALARAHPPGKTSGHHATQHAKLAPTRTTVRKKAPTPSTTSTAAAVHGQSPPPSFGLTAAAIVQLAAARTLANTTASLSINFSVNSAVTSGNTSGSLAGPYDLAATQGAMTLSVTGSSAGEVKGLIGENPAPVILDGGYAFVKPAPGSTAAGLLTPGKQYLEFPISLVLNRFSSNTGPLGQDIASDPPAAVELFDTAAVQATPAGAGTVAGAAVTNYQAAVDVAKAAAAGGPAQSLYQQIEKSSPGTRSISALVSVSGSGQVVQVQVSGSTPASNGASATSYLVSLSLSGFGEAADVTIPAATVTVCLSGQCG